MEVAKRSVKNVWRRLNFWGYTTVLGESDKGDIPLTIITELLDIIKVFFFNLTAWATGGGLVRERSRKPTRTCLRIVPQQSRRWGKRTAGGRLHLSLRAWRGVFERISTVKVLQNGNSAHHCELCRGAPLANEQLPSQPSMARDWMVREPWLEENCQLQIWEHLQIKIPLSWEILDNLPPALQNDIFHQNKLRRWQVIKRQNKQSWITYILDHINCLGNGHMCSLSWRSIQASKHLSLLCRWHTSIPIPAYGSHCTSWCSGEAPSEHYRPD